ncbi:acetate/propionate family kinase [Blastopirellula sp. JC732]|uniref:Acetate kinase n=1 Tax=Blastopirellula sediminis TaxID=2894196 RepID=A0A9X1MKH7_9BACT|nr:acetate/propionate family kinase [Blastopirellula sediminis]MCC9609246.1 acetate/propionate family kinase [Blastopirellula sediminis]MCC9627977.1 acetate/propionate family kinase [Blastopirellula sediminis]
MKVLVANLGSTSFKYRLYDMESETQLARGGIDRIGGSESSCSVEIGDWKENRTAHVPDHAVAVQQCLSQLTDPEHGCLKSADEVAAIGFKAVHGGRVSGVQRVTPDVLDAMAEMSPVAPAHNPPYINAMRLLGEKLPEIPLVAAFETGFHQTIPNRLRYYAIPKGWSDEYQIKRWGFHGASHRYIGVRSAELLGRDDLRVISCHLGGSSSLCAIRNKRSAATTMGMSPQTGLPQNNRVGDFDAYFLPMLMEKTGKSLEELLAYLGSQGGLLGISGGISGDMRDLEEAAAGGNADAQLAIDVYISEIRRYLGGMLIELGGVDAIVFTGGIGENGKQVRADVCANLSELGIELDAAKNDAAKGESAIHADGGKTQIWVIPTNEELIVARQTKQLLES